ncbi:MAG: YbaB/EbfC family nucleoid-associated protein [Lachnospiraceae bacterium]|nr:YbaB/EbfC family nucleoid-associated protein [Lachnospiraceae bacterium]
MAKRGGYPGGMQQNMNGLMKQAQRMQQKVAEAQAEIEALEVSAASGGGAVKVTVSGKKEIVKLELAEEVVDPEDIEMLQDLVIAAVNEALRQVDEISQEKMNRATGGMGGMGGLF